MFRHNGFNTWADTVAKHFPQLSKPQAFGLALWSFGMTIAKACTLSAVTDSLSAMFGVSYNTVRERLRDTYREADAKSGDKRAELDLKVCWAPWLAWVIKDWSTKQIAIALGVCRTYKCRNYRHLRL